nr:hypothetical protein I308_04578 [Cryptococcus tetragattii IND107]
MRAFEPGYDPALELSKINGPNASHVRRMEQPLIDSIVRGEEKGGYYLVIGPKGTGKGTMILDAMRKINADGVSFSHPDLEVFRLRFGKALDFDYYEDWQGSLFSRADPRNGGPALDIERALNKLEKVALRYALKNGRPLVMAFNSEFHIHLFPNTPEGHGILHQLQQRAEAWAEGGILTMIFSSDDYWCLDVMKKNASRMRILSVYDLSAAESLRALRHLRRQELANRSARGLVSDKLELESDSVLRRVYELVGGRTSYLARVARADDVLGMSKNGRGTCSWLILRHLASAAEPLSPYPSVLPPIPLESPDEAHLEKEGDHRRSSSAVNVTLPREISSADIHLPKVTYEEARRIMTRADFLEALDHYHIISIDQVVAEDGFDDALDQTRDRVDQIEGTPLRFQKDAGRVKY